MGTAYLKYRDTLPGLSVTLTGADGLPANLTGKTVKLHILLASGTILTRAMTVSAPLTGVATYAWLASDWSAGGLVVGTHRMEYEVLSAPDSRQTFPSDGYDLLEITGDIGQGTP